MVFFLDLVTEPSTRYLLTFFDSKSFTYSDRAALVSLFSNLSFIMLRTPSSMSAVSPIFPISEQLTSMWLISSIFTPLNFSARIPTSLLLEVLILLIVKYPLLLHQKLTISFSALIKTPEFFMGGIVFKCFFPPSELQHIQPYSFVISPFSFRIYLHKKNLAGSRDNRAL